MACGLYAVVMGSLRSPTPTALTRSDISHLLSYLPFVQRLWCKQPLQARD